MLSGPLPMSLNRAPQAVPGMLLVGDAAGAVNPFNGEGIAYAMETGEMAAELVHDALVLDRPGPRADVPARAAGAIRAVLHDRARLRPRDRQAEDHGRRHAVPAAAPAVMSFAMRVMANLTDGRDGDAQDRLIYVLERVARARHDRE